MYGEQGRGLAAYRARSGHRWRCAAPPNPHARRGPCRTCPRPCSPSPVCAAAGCARSTREARPAIPSRRRPPRGPCGPRSAYEHKSVSGPAPGPAPRTGPRPLGHIGSAGELGRDACQFRDQTQRRTLSLGSTPGTSHALPENERACWEPCVGETYDDAGPPSPRRPRPRPARAAPLAGLSCGGDGERGVALRPLPGGPCSKTDFEPRQPRPHPRAPAVSGPNPPHTPPPYQAARVNFRLLSLQPCPVLRLVAFSCLLPAESGTARGPSPATPGARSVYTPRHAPRGSCAPPRHMSSHLGSISPLLSGHACQLPGPSPLHVRPVLAQSLINRGALLPVTVPRRPRPPP